MTSSFSHAPSALIQLSEQVQERSTEGRKERGNEKSRAGVSLRQEGFSVTRTINTRHALSKGFRLH